VKKGGAMVSAASMNAEQELVCPKCQRTDQVQKASGLYNANTKEWYETHRSTHADGTSSSYQEKHTAHTLLGQQLAPPQQPAAPTSPALWYGLGCFIFVVFVLPFCGALFSALFPLILMPLIFIPLGLALPANFSSWLADLKLPAWLADAPTWVGIGVAVVLLIGALVSILLVVWLFFFIKRKYSASMLKYKESQSRREREELPRWQRAMDRWNNLYYCARDETVFIPGEGKAIPVAQTDKYLYDPYYHPV
jgi:hypothetical protein